MLPQVAMVPFERLKGKPPSIVLRTWGRPAGKGIERRDDAGRGGGRVALRPIPGDHRLGHELRLERATADPADRAWALRVGNVRQHGVRRALKLEPRLLRRG